MILYCIGLSSELIFVFFLYFHLKIEATNKEVLLYFLKIIICNKCYKTLSIWIPVKTLNWKVSYGSVEFMLIYMIYMKLFVWIFIDPDALGETETFWNTVWYPRLLNMFCLVHRIFFFIPFTNKMEKVVTTKIFSKILLLFYFCVWWLHKAAVLLGAQQYFFRYFSNISTIFLFHWCMRPVIVVLFIVLHLFAISRPNSLN